MSYQNLLAEVKKGLPAASYLLVAAEQFLLGEAISLIRSLVPEGERDFNFQRFDLAAPEGERTPFEQILDVANTIPFFSGRKYVVLENFQKITKKDLQKAMEYLRQPAGTSVLVLLHAGSPRKDLTDLLKGIKQVTLDIRERDVPFWIRERVRAKGFEITDGAIRSLIGCVGPEIGMLSTEIDKLVLVGKERIEDGDIAELVEEKRSYSVFALTDAIRKGDAEQVLRIGAVLGETGDAQGVLGAINWQFGQITAGGRTGVDPNASYRVFSLLSEADIAMKKSGGSYPLELLLVRLLRLSKGR